jgi:general secretion pathway protein G
MAIQHYDREAIEEREAGLSLIEVMVVVVIIGILGTIIMINVLPLLGNANTTAAQTQVSQLEQGVETYRLIIGRYPTTEEGLEALVTEPDDPRDAARFPEDGFINELPLDPWGNPFQYLYPGENGRFDIWSWGADGRPGGEGEDADIGNWTSEDG